MRWVIIKSNHHYPYCKYCFTCATLIIIGQVSAQLKSNQAQIWMWNTDLVAEAAILAALSIRELVWWRTPARIYLVRTVHFSYTGNSKLSFFGVCFAILMSLVLFVEYWTSQSKFFGALYLSSHYIVFEFNVSLQLLIFSRMKNTALASMAHLMAQFKGQSTFPVRVGVVCL